MKYPRVRLRRLRENPAFRSMLSEHTLLVRELVQPLFVKEGISRPIEISSLPGQFQLTRQAVVSEAERMEALGLGAIILFGIPAKKDTQGRAAFAKGGVIQKAVSAIKKKCPRLLVITDVCLCEYLSHGHCGHIEKGRIVNDASVRTLAWTALSHARAGADIVAPSDMMDGRVQAIRRLLDKNDFKHTPIISYAVKYASCFYAPFREAAQCAPAFGDRSSYQMNPANAREALREAQTDLEEGADVLLVKPALAFMDIMYRIKERFDCPVGCYSVSGEYAMIKAASQRGWMDEKKAVLETHLSMKRSGASLIFTYWAKDLARWLAHSNGAKP
ncbi:MAG: delta-aminolevulinic acid dehydratase [Candidatus Omnitrophica bacterium CG1_02_49_16]|nr:MAG: delta-aminolevulinic acid dehydratase [Candidatus Omnitrophica bacterium CG1_02_49_16]